MTKGYTPLFDYQEFCELLDHIQDLKSLASQYRCDSVMYQKKIHEICNRVEKDFSDTHHIFTGWVDGTSVDLGTEHIVQLTCDRKAIFILMILNRRRELGLPIFQSDLDEFNKLCKQTRMAFPKSYFIGV